MLVQPRHNMLLVASLVYSPWAGCMSLQSQLIAKLAVTTCELVSDQLKGSAVSVAECHATQLVYLSAKLATR